MQCQSREEIDIFLNKNIKYINLYKKVLISFYILINLNEIEYYNILNAQQS